MSDNNKAWMAVAGGCLGVGLLGFLCCGGLLFYFGTLPEGGVRVGNTMEEYASEYIDANGLIDSDETIHAYYDVSPSFDSTECAILTNRRLIYHRNNSNTEMVCEDIVLVASEDLGMMGDGITVKDVNGDVIYIEIIPLSNAPVFLSALERIVEENEAAD